MMKPTITIFAAALAVFSLLPQGRAAAADQYAVQVVIDQVIPTGQWSRIAPLDYVAATNIGGSWQRTDVIFNGTRAAPGGSHAALISSQDFLLGRPVRVDIALRDLEGRLVDISGRGVTTDLHVGVQYNPRNGSVRLWDVTAGGVVRPLTPLRGRQGWATGPLVSAGLYANNEAQVVFEVNVIRVP